MTLIKAFVADSQVLLWMKYYDDCIPPTGTNILVTGRSYIKEWNRLTTTKTPPTLTAFFWKHNSKVSIYLELCYVMLCHVMCNIKVYEVLSFVKELLFYQAYALCECLCTRR